MRQWDGKRNEPPARKRIIVSLSLSFKEGGVFISWDRELSIEENLNHQNSHGA
jgi:hypothetical protein